MELSSNTSDHVPHQNLFIITIGFLENSFYKHYLSNELDIIYEEVGQWPAFEYEGI